jgi:hypothetical protein
MRIKTQREEKHMVETKTPVRMRKRKLLPLPQRRKKKFP